MTALLHRSVQALALVLALALTPVAPTTAHQQKESITRVLFNTRTGNIEVMHRFLLHDAEHASRRLFGETADLLSNPADCDRFENYVHQRFALADQDGAAIALKPVGNEIDTRFLWVYAEAKIPDGLTALEISHDALRDLWPEQTNLVNVERGKTVRSAIFNGESRALTVRF